MVEIELDLNVHTTNWQGAMSWSRADVHKTNADEFKERGLLDMKTEHLVTLKITSSPSTAT